MVNGGDMRFFALILSCVQMLPNKYDPNVGRRHFQFFEKHIFDISYTVGLIATKFSADHCWIKLIKNA